MFDADVGYASCALQNRNDATNKPELSPLLRKRIAIRALSPLLS